MSVIEQAVAAGNDSFRSALGDWQLTSAAEEVVDNMMAVTLVETMERIEDPDNWWNEYQEYATRHAGLIARVAISLATAGKREEIDADDLVQACDIIVKRAKKVCPEALGNRTGCSGYSVEAIMVG